MIRDVKYRNAKDEKEEINRKWRLVIQAKKSTQLYSKLQFIRTVLE